jgi:hypothetical protein
VAAPAPTAEHALAARAAEVARILAVRVLPACWAGPGFARDVDLVRRQLGPLHDRRMLAASYERESSRLVALRRLASDPGAPPLVIDATDAAYGIRWLELATDGEPLPSWVDLARELGHAAG